ncbi:MAG: hypothetical protein U9Q83_08140, partial [Bacteroidota bacterium]|nr:hypothetical protein [Bacteroidota bacterium]
MTKKNAVVTIIFILIVQISYSQVVRYSNEYFNIGVGARNIAMANSTTADISDFSAGYYNPAGLNDLNNKYQIGLLHSQYFGGIANYDYAGFAYKIDDSTGVSASLIRMGIDNIQNTLFLYDDNGNIDYDRIELFSVADYGFLLSYGRKSKIKGLSYGASAKIIYRSQGEFAKAYGFGIDLGLQYILNKWHFGAKLSNATTSFTAWFYNIDDQMTQVFLETGNDLPKNSLELTMPVLSAGVSRYWQFEKNIGLRSEFDLIFTFDGKRNAIVSFNPVSFYPQLGLEFDYAKKIYLRAGVNNFQLLPDYRSVSDTSSDYLNQKSFDFTPNVGLGVVFKRFSLDYALT